MVDSGRYIVTEVSWNNVDDSAKVTLNPYHILLLKQKMNGMIINIF